MTTTIAANLFPCLCNAAERRLQARENAEYRKNINNKE